ncbi:MAG: pyruvate ferredoxin oxidoreductase [Nitrospirae bacterium]|nr:pyruvate ferredoxin oxidoreductase [Nitrospirota bacterium]
MREALEGSQAIARAVALCRPQVVAAYPITPQTHIVEALARLIADGFLEAELVSVESEFSAASVVLGAASAGSRSYTASASQGLLLMSEVLYNISGMRVPVVLTCANRAVSAPVSIWNDHQDSMAVRDAGWIQLFCADNQEAVDTTIQAFRISERTELPVMVCVDGFTLTHTLEPIDLPEADQVDAFLPPFTFARTLSSSRPMSQGTLVSPEFFTEIRALQHEAFSLAEREIQAADRDWAGLVGRDSGGLLRVEGDREAEVAILVMGSLYGTLKDAYRSGLLGRPVRLLCLRSFRPFPVGTIRQAVSGLSDLIVLDRALSPGSGGIVAHEIRSALYGVADSPRVVNFAVGLGGRDVPGKIFREMLEALEKRPPAFSIFDLDPEKLPLRDQGPPEPSGVHASPS